MRVFVRVAEAGGFSAVARETNTTQPTISRMIAALEHHLGSRLLHRSTRAVSLTDDGRQYYALALQALEAVTEADSAIGRRRAKPFGRLRLGTPVALGRLHIAPRLAAFMRRYPDLQIDMALSDAFVDLVESGLDLAIRVGEITDPSLVARRIGMTRRIAVVAPEYLRHHPAPSHPGQLIDHDCIVYTRLSTGDRWHFDGPDGPIDVQVRGRFRADNSEAVREGVLCGLGIGILPIWMFADEIRRGDVRVILKDFEPRRLPIHAVYTSRRQIPSKVRAMIDYLADEFRLDPMLSDYGV